MFLVPSVCFFPASKEKKTLVHASQRRGARARDAVGDPTGHNAQAHHLRDRSKARLPREPAAAERDRKQQRHKRPRARPHARTGVEDQQRARAERDEAEEAGGPFSARARTVAPDSDPELMTSEAPIDTPSATRLARPMPSTAGLATSAARPLAMMTNEVISVHGPEQRGAEERRRRRRGRGVGAWACASCCLYWR